MSFHSDLTLDESSGQSPRGDDQFSEERHPSFKRASLLGPSKRTSLLEDSEPLCRSTSGPIFSEMQKIPSLFAQIEPPPAIILYSHGDCSHDREDYVSDEFVEEFNKRIGDTESKAKAIRLMEKMRFLAGLHPSSVPEKEDIPAARTGFAMLAALNDQELKVEALENLEYLLEHDPITKKSSNRLVSLTIKVMNQLNKELIQTESLEIQIKTAKIYGLLVELIQRHFTKRHINAITHDLRAQLEATASSLKDLNRLEDSSLTFYTESSLEGINRILDDSKLLVDILGRLYNLGMAGVSIYVKDLSHFPSFVDGAVGGLEPKIKFGWYDAGLTILKMAREAMSGNDFNTRKANLLALQKFTFDNQKLDWKFLFLAIDLMTSITINSDDPKIRSMAYNGYKQFEEFPGLTKFASCDLLGKKPDFSPMMHLKRPKLVNRDATIRLHVAKSLIRISDESPDPLIRGKARLRFLSLHGSERSEKVLYFTTPEFNKVQGYEQDWIHERPPYDDIYPVKKLARETTSLTPRRSIDCAVLFRRTVYTPETPV